MLVLCYLEGKLFFNAEGFLTYSVDTNSIIPVGLYGLVSHTVQLFLVKVIFVLIQSVLVLLSNTILIS